MSVVEIVDSAEEAAALELPPLLVRDAVEGFLDGLGLGSGPSSAIQTAIPKARKQACCKPWSQSWRSAAW